MVLEALPPSPLHVRVNVDPPAVDISTVSEPVVDLEKTHTNQNRKTLHDQLKKSKFTIGLNDKLAFITHLFDGKMEDYECALSQLNTLDSFELARDFIQNKIKTEYSNWVDKSDIENRFLEIIETKFGS